MSVNKPKYAQRGLTKDPQSADMNLNEPKSSEIGLNKLKWALSSNDPKWP